MLEKAKNRKIFYFFVFIILGISLFIPFVSATETTSSFEKTKCGYIAKIINNYNFSIGVFATTGQSPITQINLGGPRYTSKYANYIDINRGFYVFNTSSLPDDIYITNAWINCSISQTNSLAANEYISIVDFLPNSYNTIVPDDFNNFGNSAYSTFALNDYDGYSSSGANISIPVDLIHVDGYTGIGLRMESDRLTELNYPSTSYYPPTSGTSTLKADSIVIGYESLILYVTYSDEPPITYQAGINISPNIGDSPLSVTLTDTSINFPVEYPYPEYILSFGDGNEWTGERQYNGENWFHVYENPGSYLVTYNVTYDGISYYDTATVTVTEGTSNYIVQVHGLNTNPIGGANVSIWYDGYYQTSRGTYDETGNAYFNVPAYRFVNGTVTKSGYQTAYFDTYIYPENNLEFVTLYTDNEIPGTGDTYGNYIVSFKNAITGEEVGYSNIEVYSDSGYTSLFYDEYSNSGGVWTGLLPMNTTYYYKYPETIGYYSQSWSYNLTSSPSYKTVNLVPKSGATSTPTPTPTSITTTITPTVTYTLNTGNLSTLNVKERFTNLLVLAGFQNAESADLIFAMIIILGCTALIGWITLSGSGAGMGAIIGFVFSLGLGLIPLWLLIAAIFFACLYVALKLFGESGE